MAASCGDIGGNRGRRAIPVEVTIFYPSDQRLGREQQGSRPHLAKDRGLFDPPGSHEQDLMDRRK